jgi:hypothetical protein
MFLLNRQYATEQIVCQPIFPAAGVKRGVLTCETNAGKPLQGSILTDLFGLSIVRQLSNISVNHWELYVNLLTPPLTF